jgi:4-nitrophenyl phosphatase
MAWVLDLDGVIWLGDQPIEGSIEAVKRLDSEGEQILFVTNFSAMRKNEMEAKLNDFGLEATDRVITSAMAAASLVEPGERVLVCGGPGVTEAVEARGAEAIDPSHPFDQNISVDAVVVGFHKNFDFNRLAVCARALHQDARLITTNIDPTYPTVDGLLPGNGSITAAVATAGKVDAVVAGKPHQPVAQLIMRYLGISEAATNDIVVGDLPSTDGLLATELNFRFGLVLSGVTNANTALKLDPQPDMVCPDLASLVSQVLG